MPAAYAAGSGTVPRPGTAYEADMLRWTTGDVRPSSDYEFRSSSPLPSILDPDIVGLSMSPMKRFDGAEESKGNAAGVFQLPPPLVAVAGDHEEGSMDDQAVGTGGDTSKILPMVSDSDSRRTGSTENNTAASCAGLSAIASSETMMI